MSALDNSRVYDNSQSNESNFDEVNGVPPTTINAPFE